jgi:hypothetical protein
MTSSTGAARRLNSRCTRKAKRRTIGATSPSLRCGRVWVWRSKRRGYDWIGQDGSLRRRTGCSRPMFIVGDAFTNIVVTQAEFLLQKFCLMEIQIFSPANIL